MYNTIKYGTSVKFEEKRTDQQRGKKIGPASWIQKL